LSIDQVYYTEDRPTGNVDVYGEPTTTKVTTARDEIIDIVTKYAIEYRYYVESYNKTETNYQPNSQVMAYMKDNKNIVKKAKDKLNATIRQNIERNIVLFENSNAESYSSLVTGINNSISQQQSLRSQALGQ
jgi:hypothetical protein